jgi:hypothetical protein
LQGSAAPKLDRTRGFSWRDRTGERVGRLVVTGWAGYGRHGGKKRPFWHCHCDCGATTVRCLMGVRSCGCLQREARDAGRRSTARKTMLALEKLGLGPGLTLADVACLFHVKRTTIARRMNKWPDEPQRWVERKHWRQVRRVRFHHSRKEIWDELRRDRPADGEAG